MQPLPIPNWKWEIISLDFITGLPRNQNQNDSIMVVVDKLSKAAHFIPVKTTYKAANIADIFLKQIFGYMVCRKLLFQIGILNSLGIFGNPCSKD